MNIEPRLRWPSGVNREAKPVHSKFGDRSIRQSMEEIQKELGRFGAAMPSTVTIDLKLDPKTSQGFRLMSERDGDPGAAVYFSRKGTPQVLAIDRYTMPEDNLWAIARTIAALRQIERDGGPSILDRAMEGFSALPGGQRWPWSVLGVEEGCSFAEADEAYRALAKELHPDVGGSTEEFQELQEAWQEIKGRLGK